MQESTRRLLVINPNTTTAMTARVAAVARRALPQVEVTEATGRFGARYIASRASFAVAGHAALECYAEHGAAADAVLLACFGDPGLDAIREVASVPVIGLVEAATAEAAAGGRRFAIVTGGERWGPMLWEMLRARDLHGACVAIRTVAPTGGMIAADPEGARALLAEACAGCAAVDGADAVILGGAGLIGLAANVQPQVPVPVICSIEAGIRAAPQALATESRPSPLPLSPVEAIGLAPALTHIFERAG